MPPHGASLIAQVASPRGSNQTATKAAAAGVGKRSTVGTRFAADLAALVKLLESVNAQFIRCIKPNMLKARDVFDGGSVLRQVWLPCSGARAAVLVLVGCSQRLHHPGVLLYLHPACRLLIRQLYNLCVNIGVALCPCVRPVGGWGGI